MQVENWAESFSRAATTTDPRGTTDTHEGSVCIAAKVIAGLGPNAFSLEIDGSQDRIEARTAFSCLVQPIPGDRVLVSRSARAVHILAVLERLVPDSATIALPSGGALSIEGNAIVLAADSTVSIDTDKMTVTSTSFTLRSGTMTMLSKLGSWISGTMRLSSQLQEISADTISTQSIDRVAVVERADTLKAGTLTQTIDKVATTSAPIAVIATAEDLRLDGKRVTVG